MALRLENKNALMGEPVDVANTALFLASEEGRYYTGSILHPDGGIVMQ
ncbi:SDR family oxidoreductase [Candidatus Binatus sp.]|jgi:3-oxoacyl-[acyl-carrier protein] reductase